MRNVMRHIRHSGTVQLETTRLLLRRVKETDCTAIYISLASEQAVIDGLGWDQNPSELTTASYVRDIIKGYDDVAQPLYFWLIEDKATGAVLGVVLVDSYTVERRVAEVDYAISSEYRGQGYAPEALRCVIEHLFSIGFHRVEAVYNTDNHASGRVMEKVGMRYEGVLRGRALRLNDKGLPDDLKICAILACDPRPG